MSAPTFVLESERLVLREYSLDDLDDLFEILGDPETMRYYPRPRTREESLDWIERNLEWYRRDGFGLWVIVAKGTGEFLGNCGPTRKLVDGRDEVELGWHVKRSHWRRGIATEAAAACRDHCLGTLGMKRLISLVRPENVPSRRVAEKIGMTVEKEVEYSNLPHLVYALGAEG